MRGKSPLANRWTHIVKFASNPVYFCKTREEAVEKYEAWLRKKVFVEHDELVCGALDKIKKDSVLVCCCLPKRCHGQPLIEVWEEYQNE